MQDITLLQAFSDAAKKAGRATPQIARARLIFALDATASRHPTWDMASNLTAGMFEAADKIGGLDVQLVYFQGAGTCRAGPWVSNARLLTNAMTGITCRSGLTQISRLLDQVRREHAGSPVAAFVFIGDTVEENPDELAGKAATLGVKGFVFHEDPQANHGAVEPFKSIAAATGGVYLPFDQQSAARLGELLAGIAAWAVGGLKALAARDDAGAKFLLEQLKL